MLIQYKMFPWLSGRRSFPFAPHHLAGPPSVSGLALSLSFWPMCLMVYIQLHPLLQWPTEASPSLCTRMNLQSSIFKCFTSSSLDSVNGDTIHLDANVINITITVFLIWVTDVDRITRTLNLTEPSLPNNSISSRKVIQKAERTPEGS